MKLNKLTARQVSLAQPWPAGTLSKKGKPRLHAERTFGDGGGLYLRVRGDSKAFVFRFYWNHKPTELGLGSAFKVTLAEARDLADKARRLVAKGINPIEARKEGRKLALPKPTFGQCADSLIAAKSSEWRNEKHRQQWRATLETKAAPLWAMPVDQVDLEAVLSVLQPVWQATPETASRLRGRIEAVIDAARANGFIGANEANPARWKGHLDHLLARRTRVSRGHHAAMAYQQVPEFIGSLRDGRELALKFLILSACRVGEVRGATWGEMDLAARVWTIPAGRMKAGVEHRVPLTAPMMDILEGLGRSGDRVFPVSYTTLLNTMRKLAPEGETPHGFRSAFRDWAGNETSFPREIAEECLAHASGDATERAYRRSDALERRRALMDAWGAYCTGEHGGNVLSLKRA